MNRVNPAPTTGSLFVICLYDAGYIALNGFMNYLYALILFVSSQQKVSCKVLVYIPTCFIIYFSFSTSGNLQKISVIRPYGTTMYQVGNQHKIIFTRVVPPNTFI